MRKPLLLGWILGPSRLNKRLRREIYENMIAYYSNTNKYHSAMCPMISYHFVENKRYFPLFGKGLNTMELKQRYEIIMDKLPELKKQKPAILEMEHNGLWFPFSNYGRKQRLMAIENALKLL